MRHLRIEHLPGVLSGDRTALYRAFAWTDTPQGHSYWYTRANGKVPLSDEDRGYLIRAANEQGPRKR